jgi:Bacterial membrane protein YfhO
LKLEDQPQPETAESASERRPDALLSVRTGTLRNVTAPLKSLSRSPWAGNLLHASTIVVLYSAFYTAFFLIALLQGRVLAPGDGFVFYGPAFYGERALWTTDLFSGFPVAADPQSMTWYPVAWFFGLFPGSLSWFVISAYVLASTFTYAYLQTLTGSRFASAIGGLTYGASGFFFLRTGHVSLIHVAAWLPAIIWTTENLMRCPSRGWMAALAVSIAVAATAGHTQLFFYSLVVAGAYAFVRGWSARDGWLRYYSLGLAGSVLGLGIAAVLLLPAYELLSESVRPSLTFEYFSGFALPWRQLPQLAFPSLFGRSGIVDFYTYRPAYFGDPSTNWVESTGFVGLIPPVLALMALWLSRRSIVAWTWAAIGSIALLLALGDSTPLARLMFHVPVYNLFRSHGRLLMVVTFAFAVLAGLGTAAAMRAADKDRIRAFFFGAVPAIGVVFVVVVGLWAFADTYRWWAQSRAGVTDISVAPWKNDWIGVPLAMLVVGLIALWIWTRRPATFTSALLLVAVVLDLGSFGWFSDWRHSPPSSYLDPPAELAPYQKELAASGQRLVPLRGVGQPRDLAVPNVTRLWDIPSASGFNPLMLKRYEDVSGINMVGQLNPQSLAAENTILDLLAIRYLFVPTLSPDSGESQALAADPSRWRHAQDFPTGSAYSNERALPRAWLAHEVLALAPGQVLDAIHHAKLPDGRHFDPGRTALLEEPLEFAQQSRSGDDTVTLVRHKDTDLAVRVDTDSQAFLVLSDVWYPGWQVRIDGEPAHLYRTDYVLRGVLVPPGSHFVQFEYRPKSFVVGFAVSAASVVLLISLLAWPLLREPALALTASTRRSFRPSRRR